MPEVTICIPTWKAEPFIGRTLDCARRQTYTAIRILVSVDACDDATESICREYATQDGRIEVIAQQERLGWSRNANFLLARVQTPFFFIYFHDDIIEPTYTDELRQALLERPDATSAHCDLERFGDQSGLKPGHEYTGSKAERLIHFLIGPVKGAPLRSLARSELLARGLRFPEIGTDGFWRCHPFVLNLLAAGPALHVPRVLYRQWFRPQSVTAKWSPKTLSELAEGQRESARLCLQIINDAAATDEERNLLRFCLYLFVMTHTRQNELPLAAPRLVDPVAISPVFAEARMPASVSAFGTQFEGWLSRSLADLLFLEGEHALRQHDYEAAKQKLMKAIALQPKLRKARLPAALARAGIEPASFELALLR